MKYTAEEVRAFRNITFAPSDPGYAITSAFADRIEADKRAATADSGRVDGMADLLADWRRAADVHDEIGFGAAADVGRTCAGDLEAALAAQGQGDAVAEVWSLRYPSDRRLNLSTVFDTEQEAREYADKWSDGAEVVPLYTRPTPPTLPAGVPEAVVEAVIEVACEFKNDDFESDELERRMHQLLAAAPAPEGDAE